MIIFNVAHGETHHPNAKYKKLARRLRSFSKVTVEKETLSSDTLKDCELLIIASPQTPFTNEELQVVRDYINGGGSLAVFSCDAEAQSSECNLNELLVDYGMSIDSTTLVRAVYHRYLHPKHALIQNGIVQPEIGHEKHIPLKSPNSSIRMKQHRNDSPTHPSMALSFVYPNGTTLTVQSPAYTLLSSGSTSYPVDCPIAASWESTDNTGRILVVGSADVFADDWLEKEANSQLFNVLFRFLVRQDISFDPSMGRSDFEEKECVPDISSLSNLLKPCLQENKPLPQDYKSLLCDDLYRINNDHIPDVIDLYKKLNVPHEPLTLVQPQFECPQPPLRMATHQPRMMDPPPPALELFDLDEAFSDARVRLANLTDKFSDDRHLDRYVQEASWVLGLDDGANEDIDEEGLLARRVLHHIGTKLFQHKIGLPARY